MESRVQLVLPRLAALQYGIYFVDVIWEAFGLPRMRPPSANVNYLWDDVDVSITDTALVATARTDAGDLWLLANAPAWAEVTHAS